MKRWEYNKTCNDMTQRYLDEMGEQGWELVGFESLDGYSRHDYRKVMVWKRERQEAPDLWDRYNPDTDQNIIDLIDSCKRGMPPALTGIRVHQSTADTMAKEILFATLKAGDKANWQHAINWIKDILWSKIIKKAPEPTFNKKRGGMINF